MCPSQHVPRWGEAGAGDGVVRDANGNPLADGDAVILIKDLKVKGASTVLKKGTQVKSIRWVDGDHALKRRTDVRPMKLVVLESAL